MSKKITCYQCFKEFSPHQVWFRCENTLERNPRNPCSLETDAKIGEELPHAFRLRGFLRGMDSWRRPPISCECDKCGEVSRNRICPHCHRSLPFGAGEIDAYIMAIIGSVGSGKSLYLTVLIERCLKGWVSADFKAHIEPADPDTERIFRENYVDLLLRQNQALAPNQRDQEVTPLIFKLNFRQKNRVTGREINKPLNLVFYDIAGELLSPEAVGNNMATEYLFHSSGIVYLVNPLHIEEIADLIPNPENGAAPVHTPDVILSFIKQRIQRRRNLNPADRIPIPLAVCLSQSDRLRDANGSLGFREDMFEPHRHRGAFDMRDFEGIDAEVQDKLLQWGGIAGGIQRDATSFFASHGFCASSALGESPDAGYIQNINPIRVEDPFLWMLSEMGVIPKSKG